MINIDIFKKQERVSYADPSIIDAKLFVLVFKLILMFWACYQLVAEIITNNSCLQEEQKMIFDTPPKLLMINLYIK
ncbi:hypothetical protein NIES4102_27560 [Chondrocystis sp. NIES-4102]|nr:hypothetical protein NIES4102_27560 [Chondrocystis sp. NIES-4102]